LPGNVYETNPGLGKYPGEERDFHRAPMWVAGIGTVGAIPGVGIFLLPLWFDAIYI
jgi:hypothetical protein